MDENKKIYKGGKTVKKKRKTGRNILLVLLVLIFLILALVYGYFHSKYDRIFKDGYNESWAEDYEEKINVSEELEIAMWESTVGSGVEDREAVEATGEVIWDDDVINILLIGS